MRGLTITPIPSPRNRFPVPHTAPDQGANRRAHYYSPAHGPERFPEHQPHGPPEPGPDDASKRGTICITIGPTHESAKHGALGATHAAPDGCAHNPADDAADAAAEREPHPGAHRGGHGGPFRHHLDEPRLGG